MYIKKIANIVTLFIHVFSFYPDKSLNLLWAPDNTLDFKCAITNGGLTGIISEYSDKVNIVNGIVHIIRETVNIVAICYIL